MKCFMSNNNTIIFWNIHRIMFLALSKWKELYFILFICIKSLVLLWYFNMYKVLFIFLQTHTDARARAHTCKQRSVIHCLFHVILYTRVSVLFVSRKSDRFSLVTAKNSRVSGFNVIFLTDRATLELWASAVRGRKSGGCAAQASPPGCESEIEAAGAAA